MKREMLSIGWSSFLVGLVFTVLHLAFQVFALLQSYLSGMAHFDDPLSRQAAWESSFWERVATVATFPLVRLWEHLPLPWRTYSAVEWGLLTCNGREHKGVVSIVGTEFVVPQTGIRGVPRLGQGPCRDSLQRLPFVP